MVSTTSHELLSRGVTTVVFSMGPAEPVDGIVVEVLPRSLKGAARLWRSLSRGGFDIVHYHVYSSFVPGAALPGAALSGARRVMTTHFHVVGSGPRAARAAFDRSIGWATLHGSHQIQVDTVVERDAIAQQFGLKKERFAVLPPPLAPTFADASPARPRDFSQDPFNLLFVGRLDPQKGLGIILDAMGRMEGRTARKFRLRVVGRDYLGVQGGYERVAANLRAGSVEFLGPVNDDQLKALYDSSHALVLGSRYEAFGIVLIEAMSRGLPVVATRVGGIPEVVEDGKQGLLVPWGDPEALANALLRFVNEPSLAAKLSKAGTLSVAQYLPGRVADLEIQAYRQVLT